MEISTNKYVHWWSHLWTPYLHTYGLSQLYTPVGGCCTHRQRDMINGLVYIGPYKCLLFHVGQNVD